MGVGLLLLMAAKRLVKTMSGYMKDKVAARKNVGKTTPAATTPIANAHANAVVLN